MPINPVLIAARWRPQKNTETCTCGGEEVARGWAGEGAVGLPRCPHPDCRATLRERICKTITMMTTMTVMRIMMMKTMMAMMAMQMC